MRLDPFDLAILARLQTNNRLTSDEIARAVHLSPTACQRRIKRLRAEGVIVGDVAVLSASALGRRLTLLVEVVLVRGRADVVESFKALVRAAPEVQQCYYVTGEHDFVLVVTAEDMADYERLTQRLFFGFPHVQKFHTTVVMETVKLGLGLPLPSAGTDEDE
jgi:DNA-binding Lrp family transcriptional regulator